jgi:F-type H+-transporting ATPase subunit delta
MYSLDCGAINSIYIKETMGSFIQNNQLARHYAASLYEAAKDVRQVAIVKSELETLAALLVQDAAFKAWCSNPTVGRAQKEASLVALAAKAEFSALVGNLLGVMARNNRLLLLPYLVTAFTALERAEKGELAVRVTSARPLTQAQYATIQQGLAKAFNAPIVMEMAQDSRMIGGIKIACGSLELDASVRGKLRLAEARLAQAIEQTDISQYI